MTGDANSRPSQGKSKSEAAQKTAAAAKKAGHASAAGADGQQSQRARLLEARQVHFTRSFSNIVAVMMRDPGFRNLQLADLEWLVLPAIMAGQWRMAQSPSPQLLPKDANKRATRQ